MSDLSLIQAALSGILSDPDSTEEECRLARLMGAAVLAGRRQRIEASRARHPSQGAAIIPFPGVIA